MIETFKSWFEERSPREKQLLVAMAGLFVVTILWLLYLPLTDALSSARARHADAVIRYGETKARVRQVELLGKAKVPGLSGPLDTVIRDRASEAGFQLASVEPAPGGGVAIAITSAKPAALLTWIAGLEGGGILVDQLTASDNGNKTVSVRMTLKAAAR
ncbi:type II secretion system protein GspM [Sphingomonas immobilis]|uniref:Type II secretion system protein GspM n=1 Tax=Sphingomonas immobilis TaxID=3063997 RepID=A0ABT8ZVG7_9SPHN|nr:type II secretion system protein GspM [Sphingomonas sp. CA1-15]MDO7841263.1 type II secretion system protein GspM [Sphingomonas sp. CA1-15]